MKLHGIKQKLLKVIILPLLFLTKRRIKTTQKLCNYSDTSKTSFHPVMVFQLNLSIFTDKNIFDYSY